MQDTAKGTTSKKSSLLRGAFLATLAICACLMGACSAPSESSDAGSAQDPAPAAAETVTVTVDIDSSAVADEGYPASMASEEVTLEKGATAYDAIVKTGLSLGGTSSYITSIDGLSEAQFGPMSGWLYYVDGDMPDVGCGDYVLKGGEALSWVYILDMNEAF